MILEERIIGPQLYNSHKQELGASCEDEELIFISLVVWPMSIYLIIDIGLLGAGANNELTPLIKNLSLS